MRWSELEGEGLICISTQTGNSVLIDDALGATSERLCWTCAVQHVAGAVALVAAGVGLTVVPRGAIDTSRASKLAAVATRSPGIPRTIDVVSRSGEPLTPLAGDLLRSITRHLGRPTRGKAAPID